MIFFIHSFWISCLSPDPFRHYSNLSLRRAESPDEVLIEITLAFCTFDRCSFEPSLSDSFQTLSDGPPEKEILRLELGGILRRLEAFVTSPIGCGGSDVGIA
ncbi:hypothetical protein Tco_0328620 [Tanacetum coccineum]